MSKKNIEEKNVWEKIYFIFFLRSVSKYSNQTLYSGKYLLPLIRRHINCLRIPAALAPTMIQSLKFQC